MPPVLSSNNNTADTIWSWGVGNREISQGFYMKPFSRMNLINRVSTELVSFPGSIHWPLARIPTLVCQLISILFLSLSLSKEGEELDKSAELLTFHEAITNLVESEEQLVEEHKAIIQVWDKRTYTHLHTNNNKYTHNKTTHL